MATRKFTIPASTTPTEVTVEATAATPKLVLATDGLTASASPPEVVIKDPVIAPGVPPVEPTTVLANLKFSNPANIFEGNGGFGYSKETSGNVNHPTVVTDAARGSVLRVMINSKNKDGDRLRNELTLWPFAKNGMKGTIEIDVFIPKGFAVDNGSNNFIQFHNAGKAGMIPNVSFMLKANYQLDLNLAWALPGATTHTDLHKWFDLSAWPGTWRKIKMEINWVQSSAGYFKLYFDGAWVYTYNGPMGYAFDTQGAYLKWGIHYPAGVLPAGATETSQWVQYDNLIVSK